MSNGRQLGSGDPSPRGIKEILEQGGQIGGLEKAGRPLEAQEPEKPIIPQTELERGGLTEFEYTRLLEYREGRYEWFYPNRQWEWGLNPKERFRLEDEIERYKGMMGHLTNTQQEYLLRMIAAEKYLFEKASRCGQVSA